MFFSLSFAGCWMKLLQNAATLSSFFHLSACPVLLWEAWVPRSGHLVFSRGYDNIRCTSTPAFGVLCLRASLLRMQERLQLESYWPPCLPSSCIMGSLEVP